MSVNNIIFELNKTEKLILTLEDDLDYLDSFSYGSILFEYNSNHVLIGRDTVRYNIGGLSHLLAKALNNHLALHSSILMDIGYLYNQDLMHTYNPTLRKDPSLIYKKVETTDQWVGEDYQLFVYDPTTWLYNDNHGNIILEVTPVYPWHFLDPEDRGNHKDYIPYCEWIKNYKPLLLRTIPKEIAQQWLDRANSILAKIEDNMACMQGQDNDNDQTND